MSKIEILMRDPIINSLLNCWLRSPARRMIENPITDRIHELELFTDRHCGITSQLCATHAIRDKGRIGTRLRRGVRALARCARYDRPRIIVVPWIEDPILCFGATPRTKFGREVCARINSIRKRRNETASEAGFDHIAVSYSWIVTLLSTPVTAWEMSLTDENEWPADPAA